MKYRLLVSSLELGLQTDVIPSLLNNDAFPVLYNAYIQRKRLRKKRGTELVGRLQRTITAKALGNTDGSGNFSGNILSIAPSLLTAAPNASIVPNSVTVTVGAQTFTEPATPNGTLSPNAGTINYTTGAISIKTSPVLAAQAATVTFNYYPALPVMGIEEFQVALTDNAPINLPTTVYFDTVFAYLFDFTTRKFVDAGFYKMVSPQNGVIWNGQNYQQFWSNSYQNCMFVTNNVPGFHYIQIGSFTVGNPTIITVGAPHGLVTGDMVWFNELTGADANLLQGNTYSITVAGGAGATTFTVPVNTTGKVIDNVGIFQTLTHSITGQDGIRWYDGSGSGFGFANFAPPLQIFNASTIPAPTYLVGARMILPYQNKLICIGTYERTSAGSVVYYPNRLRYSQVGTVFYNSLVPTAQTFQADAWIDNIPGRGGFRNIDTNDRILTAQVIQEILVLGLETSQRKIIGTSNPLDPYIIQTVNPEYGSESTFASVALDQGVLSVSDFGFILTSTFGTQRFDLKIPDLVYNIRNLNFGNERVSAIRDFKNGYIYFTYPSFKTSTSFPTRTLFFNYLENNFAVFREEYTTYGLFREVSTFTWATLPYKPWSSWTEPWSSGKLAARYPNCAGGNQQGFILKKDIGLAAAQSHQITALTGNTITSPDHCREVGDYILIQGCIGSTNLNATIVQIISITNNNVFVVDGPAATGTYLGLGTYSTLDNFSVKTREFTFFWKEGFGAILGSQRFLLQRTSQGEITVDIFASQNQDEPINDRLEAPWLISGNIVRTRADDSLDINRSTGQEQLWHKLANTFTGDSLQIGLRYSDAQMRNLAIVNSEMTLHAILLEYDTARSLA